MVEHLAVARADIGESLPASGPNKLAVNNGLRRKGEASGAIEIATNRDKSEADAARIALARAARLAKRMAKRDAELNQVVPMLEGAKPDAEAEAKARAEVELAAIPPESPDWIAQRLG